MSYPRRYTVSIGVNHVFLDVSECDFDREGWARVRYDTPTGVLDRSGSA